MYCFYDSPILQGERVPPDPMTKCHQSLLIICSDVTHTSVASLPSAFSMDVTLTAVGLC